MTEYQFRVHLIVPEGLFPRFGEWWQANLDPADDGSGWPKINPSGLATDTSTHREVCIALTAPELIRLMDKLADGTVPDWGTMTPAQKRAWLAQAKESLWLGRGIGISLSPNDGVWDDFAAHRALRNLKQRNSAR